MVPELTLGAWLRFDNIRRAVDASHPATILEIGPGQGALGAWLSTRATYTGVELDETSRHVAAERIGESGTVLDAMPDGEFDMVCAFEVLEHIEHDVDALAEWRERLRPGGQILLSVPAHQKRFAAGDELAGHYRRYERDQLADTARQAGFRDIEIRAHGFPFGYALEAARNAIARRSDRTETASIQERTASSGRHLQVRGIASRGLAAVAAPFRVVQRPFATSERGIGWVLVATRA